LIPSATIDSWGDTYVGSAADCLWDTMEMHCKKKSYIFFTRYMHITQSSGMGKSRMVDELAKKHFVVPINLRPRRGSQELTFLLPG
jgi:hypothetical protein